MFIIMPTSHTSTIHEREKRITRVAYVYLERKLPNHTFRFIHPSAFDIWSRIFVVEQLKLGAASAQATITVIIPFNWNWSLRKRRTNSNMQTTRWNKRRMGYAGLGLLAFYLVFSAGNKHFEAEVTLKNVEPKAVWDFVADFSKMRQLNPTMWVWARPCHWPIF